MRINVFIAQATGLSRRAADQAVQQGRVTVNNQTAALGQKIETSDTITLNGTTLTRADRHRTIMLNKPTGYVVSRDGQGSRTIYDLLPPEYHRLKPVGRLDKDSSGLLLLTSDGQLADRLTHPRYDKTKVYEITLDKPLAPTDKSKAEKGVKLADGISKLQIGNPKGKSFTVTMSEGRNRQIRRTFAALGYTVVRLHRTAFGDHTLDKTKIGRFQVVT